MAKCILCGQETQGSIGAAGIKYSFICQPCKDKEDSYLLAKIKTQAVALQLAKI